MEAVDTQYLETVDQKGFVPDENRNAFFRKLRVKNENRTCFECKARNPTWISLTYGVYVCLECSGEHRRKGVHISYVRSVEMDKFFPPQLVQMAVGGNARAWNYFKSHGMGKTSDGGRPVDYNSRITAKYKQEIERLTKETCAQFGIKKGGATDAGTAVAPVEAEPATDAAEEAALPTRAASTLVVETPQVPKAAVASAPASVVIIRKAAPAPVVESAAAIQPVHKPSGFAGQKTKQIDFDFDFDELEAEMSKPKPPPAKAAGYTGAAAATPTPAAGGYSVAPAAKPMPQAMNGSNDGTAAKFSNRKGMSSDDFFGQDETPAAKMEREARYNKFSGSGGISSDAFFDFDLQA